MENGGENVSFANISNEFDRPLIISSGMASHVHFNLYLTLVLCKVKCCLYTYQLLL